MFNLNLRVCAAHHSTLDYSTVYKKTHLFIYKIYIPRPSYAKTRAKTLCGDADNTPRRALTRCRKKYYTKQFSKVGKSAASTAPSKHSAKYGIVQEYRCIAMRNRTHVIWIKPSQQCSLHFIPRNCSENFIDRMYTNYRPLRGQLSNKLFVIVRAKKSISSIDNVPIIEMNFYIDRKQCKYDWTLNISKQPKVTCDWQGTSASFDSDSHRRWYEYEIFIVPCADNNIHGLGNERWLVGHVVDHVRIYGSKAAEGCSAFHRRLVLIILYSML